MIKNSSWGKITAPYIGAVGIFCMHCAPMAVTPLTPAEEQQAYDRERYLRRKFAMMLLYRKPRRVFSAWGVPTQPLRE